MRSGLRAEHIRSEHGAPMGAFARALRTGEGEALAFLPAPPREDGAWRRYLAEAAPRVARLPSELADALALRQRALGAGTRAEENARRLADPDAPALAVVTGQQPGLLGGPLLTFHKVAGAIALAARLDALGGSPVVPVFWSATEDHDFDEANRAVLIDAAGQVRSLKLDAQGDGRSIHDLDVPGAARKKLLAELAALLPATDRAAAAAALAEPLPDDDFGTWSVRVLLRVFGDSGLVVVEPSSLTPHLGESLAWLLDNAETIQEAVELCASSLEAAGLPAPLRAEARGATPLFYRSEPGGRRLRVALDGEQVTLRGEPSDLTRAALRERLLAEPACGSGNVVGRVFAQNRLLPVVAYIAGPSEIAYHAQIRAAAEALGAPFPLVLPRPEGTWVDPKLQRDLAAFDRTLTDVWSDAPGPSPTTNAAVDARLDALEQSLGALLEEQAARLAAAGRGPDAVRHELARIRQAWAKARPRILAAYEADEGIGRARWERLMSWLRPRGKPQERQLSPLALIARHGIDEVRAGLRCLDPLAPVHHVLRLGENQPES